MDIKDYEVKYYKRGIGLHTPKRTLIEADTKQDAFDDFKRLYPDTCTLSIKRVKVIEIDTGESKELVRMEKGICEAERSYTE